MKRGLRVGAWRTYKPDDAEKGNHMPKSGLRTLMKIGRNIIYSQDQELKPLSAHLR
jgi:hypothetical protein